MPMRLAVLAGPQGPQPPPKASSAEMPKAATSVARPYSIVCRTRRSATWSSLPPKSIQSAIRPLKDAEVILIYVAVLIEIRGDLAIGIRSQCAVGWRRGWVVRNIRARRAGVEQGEVGVVD